MFTSKHMRALQEVAHPQQHNENTPKKGLPKRFSQLQVTADEHRQINDEVMSLTKGFWPTNPSEQSDVGANLAQRLQIKVPKLVQLIKTLRTEKNDAIYVTGLPTSPNIARVVTTAFAHLLGQPFNYDSQNAGKLVMELIPDPNAGQNNNATTEGFAVHTDDAAMPYDSRVRFISLYGLVNPPNTQTGYAPTQNALSAIRGHDNLRFVEKVLRQPRYEVRFPKSFKLPTDVWSKPISILRDLENGGLETRFPSYAVRPVDASDYEGAVAIAALHAALIEHTVHFSVDPGAYLAFNNARGAHSRGAIGKGKRFILRTYALPDLSALQARTNITGPIFPLAAFV